MFKVCQAKSIFLSFDMNYDDRPNDKSAVGHGTSHQAAQAHVLVHPKMCCCVRWSWQLLINHSHQSQKVSSSKFVLLYIMDCFKNNGFAMQVPQRDNATRLNLKFCSNSNTWTLQVTDAILLIHQLQSNGSWEKKNPTVWLYTKHDYLGSFTLASMVAFA